MRSQSPHILCEAMLPGHTPNQFLLHFVGVLKNFYNGNYRTGEMCHQHVADTQLLSLLAIPICGNRADGIRGLHERNKLKLDPENSEDLLVKKSSEQV